jgi:RimJ/RimL family protein N-acetyltransferase
MHELKPAQYELVQPLFRPLRWHLTSAAVLDGNSPGRVFVDDPVSPASAFMFSPEGCYLAGDPNDEAFNSALNQIIVRQRGLGEHVQVLFLAVLTDGWQERLATILAPHLPVEVSRCHYVCRTVQHPWRSRLPESCAVHRIDRSLLDSPRLMVPDHVVSWMANNWATVDDFVERGFGFVTACRDEIVSWSLADCVSGDQCEIGIRTASGYRRRGLAAATAAATAEYALSHGFSKVGWHSPTDNLGSIATAERVGFQREREYRAAYALLED